MKERKMEELVKELQALSSSLRTYNELIDKYFRRMSDIEATLKYVGNLEFSSFYESLNDEQKLAFSKHMREACEIMTKSAIEDLDKEEADKKKG